MSPSTDYDVLFLGGGLSSCLCAYRLQQRHPSLSIAIVERDSQLGGNHTWSFHEGDLSNEQREWIAPFITKSWESYTVRFPNYERTLPHRYHAIRSITLRSNMAEFFSGTILLGTSIGGESTLPTARLILDGRGWEPTPHQVVGYQRFVGLFLSTRSPHRLTAPLLMDATVSQSEGFRFFYSLPWNEHELLVEETVYARKAARDASRSRTEILAYAEAQGWAIQSLDSTEESSLPIPLTSPRPVRADWDVIGMRAHLFHPTTGYSLPLAALTADTLAASLPFSVRRARSGLRTLQKRQRRRSCFYLALNRMMFLAASEENRYKILQRFYRLPEGLVTRFYANQLTFWDRLRLLLGKPPVSIRSALYALCFSLRRRSTQ